MCLVYNFDIENLSKIDQCLNAKQSLHNVLSSESTNSAVVFSLFAPGVIYDPTNSSPL